MKKEKFLILGVVLTLFTMSFVSCNDDDDPNPNILRFIYEPVIVESNDGGKVSMETQYGEIQAPQLSIAKAGEYYLTHFFMDTTIRPYTAYSMEYIRMGADTLSILAPGTQMSEGYDIPITDIGIFIQDKQAETLLKSDEDVKLICLDTTFFIEAAFEGSEKEKSHEFELVCSPDSIDATNNLPIFYLRAKSTDQKISKASYALNLSTAPIVETGEGLIEFNLKYKTGVNSEGKDIYKSYKNNPVKLKINK